LLVSFSSRSLARLDYDRWDALLHHIFKQTQGDAWFRPNDEISSGVALRIVDSPPEFRLFPYETPSLEPFEQAVKALNPVVAVKVRSAAVHAALADLAPDATSLVVDYNTRIQVLENIYALPAADKDQLAAFIRDERVMVVWSDSLDNIIPTCHDFDDRLIKLLWRSRPGMPGSTNPSFVTSGSALSHAPSISEGHAGPGSISSHTHPQDTSTQAATLREIPKYKRTWYGRKILLNPTTAGYPDVESANAPEKRPAKLYAPLYNGLAAGLSFVFIGNGIRILLSEVLLDQNWVRFALCSLLPLLFAVSLVRITLLIFPTIRLTDTRVFFFPHSSLPFRSFRMLQWRTFPNANSLLHSPLTPYVLLLPVLAPWRTFTKTRSIIPRSLRGPTKSWITLSRISPSKCPSTKSPCTLYWLRVSPRSKRPCRPTLVRAARAASLSTTTVSDS
jgi:hypothetical protein